MKKYICYTILFMLPILMYATDYYSVTANVLNVRSQPSKNGTVIGVVRRGEIVSANNEFHNGWIKISTSSLTGYVSAEYLNFSHSENTYVEQSRHKNPKLVLKKIAGKFLGWFVPILLIIISISSRDKSVWYDVFEDGTIVKRPSKDDGSCSLFFIGAIWLAIKIYNLF